MTRRDLFSDRAGIADVRWALRGAAPTLAIRAAIQGLLEGGATVGACRLRRVKFKPGRKLTVTYDAWIRARHAHVARPVVVVWDRGEGVARGAPQVHELEAEAACRGLAAPFRRLQARVPELDAFVMASPLDPRLPQLVRLCDPAYVAAMLEAASAEPPHNAYRVRTIRYRPGERHVLRYEPGQGAPGRAVFAKLSRRDADVSRAFRVATHVADCLDASGGMARALRPLACVEKDGVILFPEVRGRPLSDSLRAGDGGVTRHLEAAARALRVLHSAPVRVGEALARDFVTDVEKIRRASEHIMTLLPRTGACIDRTLERACALYDRLPPEPSAFTHGDFKADHVWVSSGRVLVLDFGSCGSGDPALDVGKFLADLDWWCPDSGRRSTRARSAFLAAYGCTADGGRARLQRAGVYEALFLVMFAAHRVLLHESRWAERAARLVSRAAEVVDEL